jgi:hypothetical protein
VAVVVCLFCLNLQKENFSVVFIYFHLVIMFLLSMMFRCFHNSNFLLLFCAGHIFSFIIFSVVYIFIKLYY